MMTYTRIWILVASMAFSAFTFVVSPLQAESDAWSTKVTWRSLTDGMYVAPWHATLLPDGRILFIGEARDTEDPFLAVTIIDFVFTMSPTPLGGSIPAEVWVSPMEPPLDMTTFSKGQLIFDDLRCSGHTLTSDGDFFSAGGTRGYVKRQQVSITGLPYALTFNGANENWTRIPANMEGQATSDEALRWYPTCTRLADSRILVTGGFELVWPDSNLNVSAEIFDPGTDPATGTWEVVSPYGFTPTEIVAFDYTHVFQLPASAGNLDVLMFGALAVPQFLSLSQTIAWSSGQGRPGTLAGEIPNDGASSTLLPLRLIDGQWGYSNGSVLTAGGSHGSTHERHVDVYESLSDAWLPRVDLGVGRHHPATVLLPDGRVLIALGHNDDNDPVLLGKLRKTQYIDPANGFALSSGTAEMAEMRGYHSVAVLLPDGRVLVGGGNTSGELGNEQSNFRYYHPPYLSQPRPEIQSAPAILGFGDSFSITWSGGAASDVVEVVLMGLGSMPHSFDTNQRYVQLEVASSAAGTATVIAPTDPRTAPPGYYMLFLLDANRVPSIAKIVKLRAPLRITTTSLSDGTVDVAYSQTLQASGGTPPYSWVVSAGSLPDDLSLASSGEISGTPATGETFDFTVLVTDGSSPVQTATQALSITVSGGGSCTLGQPGDSCTSNSDCCSDKCKGKPGQKTCKAAE